MGKPVELSRVQSLAVAENWREEVGDDGETYETFDVVLEITLG